MNNKIINVGFISQKLKHQFDTLKDKQLYHFIDHAIDDLKKNPACGTKIQKKLWPKEYKKKYEITNLWKYDLPSGWRLLYSVANGDVVVLAIIIEWFSHKEYERKFKY